MTPGYLVRSVNRMPARRAVLVVLVVASLAGCDENEPARDPGAPHPPASAEERALADRYREFAAALERGDADGICRQLAPSLARSYRCGEPGAPQLPKQLRQVEVSREEIYAAIDPVVSDEIQISAPTRGEGSLIVFFAEAGNREWRIEQVMIGSYG